MTTDDISVATNSPLNIEQLSRLVALAAGLFLVISTAFDFCFLFALDLSFWEVQTTIADHVRSAIVWAPEAALISLAVATFELVSGAWNPSGHVSTDGTGQRKFWTRRKGNVAVVAVGAIILIVGFLIIPTNISLFACLIAIWTGIVGWALTRPTVRAKFSMHSRLLILGAPMLLMYIGMLGYSHATFILNKSEPAFIVQLKTETAKGTEKLLGLRKFSEVTVLVTFDRKIKVVPSSDVLSIEVMRAPDAHLSRLCRWWRLACPRPLR
jgi:hypothetical protein